MSIEEFLLISQQKQVDIISEKGTLLAYRREGLVIYDLYSIELFYVEFSYNISYKGPVTVRIFHDPEELKPYFDKMDVEGLRWMLTQLDASGNQKKSEDLLKEGVFLGERSDGEFKILLYRINELYIEQIYEGKNNIKRGLRTFFSTDEVTGYINKQYLNLN